MSHLSISASGPIAAASLFLLWLALACLHVQRGRARRQEHAGGARRRALADALDRRDDRAVAAHCRRARTSHGHLRDLQLLLRGDLAPRARTLLTVAAHAAGLVDQLLGDAHSDDAIVRGRAAALIGALSPANAIDTLEPMLADRDADVRLVAARALGQLESREAARALIRALERDPHDPDRLLEQLGRPFAVRELVLAVYRPGSAPIRGLLAEAIGLTRSLHGVATLASLVRVGDDEERLRACRALGRIGRAEVVPLLVEALADDAWPVRAQAARGLTGLAGPTGVGELERALADRAWWVRANAAEALGFAGDEGIVALERAARGSDRFAAERAREALALAMARGGSGLPRLEIAA